jgi:SEC-C motif
MTKDDYRKLPNDDLVELFFTKGDQLSNHAMSEVIRRGNELLPVLSEIVMDRLSWTTDGTEWWAPVHATYAIGAIGGEDSLIPLLASLRWSDAYDNDWATEDLPSILGSLGEISFNSLVDAVLDRSAGWSARSIAMDALGSQAIRNPSLEEEIMAIIASILADESEEHGARRSAAYVLVDFRRRDQMTALINFATEDLARHQQNTEYRNAFAPEQIIKDLGSPRHELAAYTHNWLSFYEATEAIKRSEQWSPGDKGKSKSTQTSESPQERNNQLMMGRSIPCPCGSGRPYSRCCSKKLH